MSGMKIGLKKKIINGFKDINETLINNNNFIRDGHGHMWKIENNKLFYKPQGINNFFEVKIKGGWFIDPIECIEVENYKTK
jgi:hypothetical protein